MAAEVLAQGGAAVTVYDAMPSAGRKLLMAGRGGLNLTHSEPLPAFLARYREAASNLAAAIDVFPPQALRDWSEALGQPTFVGSSGRVFPQAFKASPLLRAWLRRLDSMGVQFALRHRWTGWDANGRLTFQTPDGQREIEARATVLALGGASWPRLGSDGAWTETLAARGVRYRRFVRPIPASPSPGPIFFAIVSRANRSRAWRCLSVRTAFAAKPSSPAPASKAARSMRCRQSCARRSCSAGQATLQIALRPDLETKNLIARLSASKGKQSLSNFLRKAAHLSPVAIGLLQEAAKTTGVSLASLSPADLASLINAVPVQLTGAPRSRARSRPPAASVRANSMTTS